MELHALVTIELKNADDSKRDKFYEILKEENWKKLDKISTTWKVSFNDTSTKEKASIIIETDLKKAMIESKVERVDYAYQISGEKVVVKILRRN